MERFDPPPLISSDMAIKVFTAENRPDLWVAAQGRFDDLWPEYNLHGDHADTYFSVLSSRFAAFQFVLHDEKTELVVARGRTVPFHWDGTDQDLPAGIDAVGLRAVTDPRPATSLSALAAEVASDQQGRGLSRTVLQTMAELAERAGLTALLAPVRPVWKDRYPLIPIDRYARWRRRDGLPFDPWMRVHARIGARVLRAEPRSMKITGSVADWQRWTDMAFPEDGCYVFPGGLAPLDVADGIGRYWEPNVWMIHHLQNPDSMMKWL